MRTKYLCFSYFLDQDLTPASSHISSLKSIAIMDTSYIAITGSYYTVNVATIATCRVGLTLHNALKCMHLDQMTWWDTAYAVRGRRMQA